ncbi:MAG: FIST N-terminal domain-containing protein [Bacteroidota bacterium]
MDSNNCFSIASQELAEFKQLLNTKIEERGKPSLAILFVNADLDIEGIHTFLDQWKIPNIGCSAAGELYDDIHEKGIYSGLFMYMSEESFTLYHSNAEKPDLTGKELGSFTKEAFTNPGVYLLVASKDIQTDNYIQEIQKATTPEIPLYGGFAFDNLKFEEYTVFSNGYLSHNGIVAIVFDCDCVEIHGDSYSGWDSIGTYHTITKSIGNELLEIDGRPAFDIFNDYFDYLNMEKAAREEEDRLIIGNHPIKVYEANGSTHLKSPMELDLEKKSLKFYCSIPVGTQFKFCNNPKIEITENLIQRLESLKGEIRELDCVLITSCASRDLTLGPFFKREIRQLHGIWDKPMAGFISGGEIGNVLESNMSYFHNVTSVFTGFKLK